MSSSYILTGHKLCHDRLWSTICLLSTNERVLCIRGGPKVSHWQMIKIVLNRIKACQLDYIYSGN